MEGFAEFRGGRIHFSDRGLGPTMVFLHGFLESLDIWNDFTSKLEKEFRVIAIDLPGFGKSTNIAEVHTMEMMAQAVHTVLQELNTGQVVMTGHSMGGYTSLAYAASYPEKIKGLVIFHSHAAADTEEAKANRDRAVRAVGNSHKTFIHNFIPDLFAKENRIKLKHEIEALQQQASVISQESVIAALEGMKARYDRKDVLCRAKFPVAFIVGKEDSRMPAGLILEQAQLPRHAEVLILGNTGHMGFLEARETTRDFIRSFTQRAYSSGKQD